MKRIIPETARLQLREMEPSDIESLSSILQDSNTMYAYFGFGSWGVRILTE